MRRDIFFSRRYFFFMSKVKELLGRNDEFTSFFSPDPLTPPTDLFYVYPLDDLDKDLRIQEAEELAKKNLLIHRVSRTVSCLFSYVPPIPTASPKLLCLSVSLARSLGIDTKDPDLVSIFSGNALPPHLKPWANNYGGHQFGYFAGQLGDGRCVSLGEIVNTVGKRYELSLKGSGRTPYSRSGDGLSTLASSLREFLACEYMAELGVPTTRALTLIQSTSKVAYRYVI
jgi:uncharacterized protein YdiU (UPF0061 family)